MRDESLPRDKEQSEERWDRLWLSSGYCKDDACSQMEEVARSYGIEGTLVEQAKDPRDGEKVYPCWLILAMRPRLFVAEHLRVPAHHCCLVSDHPFPLSLIRPLRIAGSNRRHKACIDAVMGGLGNLLMRSTV